MKKAFLTPSDTLEHSTNPNAGLTRDFVRRALERRRAQKIALPEDTSSRELRLRNAQIEQEMNELARLESLTLLAKLPDFNRMRRLENGDDVYRAIREVSDRYAYPMAAITGRSLHPGVVRARNEAVKAVCDAAPKLTDRVISLLFSGMSIARVRAIRLGIGA